MEAMNAQVRALTEELGILKSELVQVKSVHANLHQQAVEAGAHNSRMFAEQAGRLEAATKKIDDISNGAGSIGGGGGFYPKPLIEAKQVEVSKFAGAVNDDRTRFLDWVEKAKDRISLYAHKLVPAMEKIEGQGFIKGCARMHRYIFACLSICKHECLGNLRYYNVLVL